MRSIRAVSLVSIESSCRVEWPLAGARVHCTAVCALGGRLGLPDDHSGSAKSAGDRLVVHAFVCALRS